MEANTKRHLKLSCLFTPLHCKVVKTFNMLPATRSSKRAGTAAAFLRIICSDKPVSKEYLIGLKFLRSYSGKHCESKPLIFTAEEKWRPLCPVTGDWLGVVVRVCRSQLGGQVQLGPRTMPTAFRKYHHVTCSPSNNDAGMGALHQHSKLG